MLFVKHFVLHLTRCELTQCVVQCLCDSGFLLLNLLCPAAFFIQFFKQFSVIGFSSFQKRTSEVRHGMQAATVVTAGDCCSSAAFGSCLPTKPADLDAAVAYTHTDSPKGSTDIALFRKYELRSVSQQVTVAAVQMASRHRPSFG